MEDLLDSVLLDGSEGFRLWNPESELSPLTLLMLGRKAVSLLAQEEVRERRSERPGGILVELPDLDRLGTLEREGLLVFLPEKCLILVQKWFSWDRSPDSRLACSDSLI